MEISILYELLFNRYIGDYRKELENEKDDNFTKWLNTSRIELEKTLNTEQLQLLNKYKHNYDLREEDIDFQTGIKILNYGIKIGMELQKAFDSEED